MFKLKELGNIIIVIILFAFLIRFLQDLNAFLTGLIIAFAIITVNILTKKIMASYLEAEIEQKIWHFQRWGYYTRSQFKKPKPIGAILPFILVWLSYPTGFLKLLTFLQFDVKPTSARAAKRHGLHRYIEMTEWHIALIAGIGIFANLVLAIIAYIIGNPIMLDIAKYSIYYAAWNMLPISQLDGTKIFFGSRILYTLLAILTLISLGYALFLV